MAQAVSDDLTEDKKQILKAIEEQAKHISTARGQKQQSLQDFLSAAEQVMPEGSSTVSGSENHSNVRHTSMDSVMSNNQSSTPTPSSAKRGHFIAIYGLIFTLFIMVALGYVTMQTKLSKLDGVKASLDAQLTTMESTIKQLTELNQGMNQPYQGLLTRVEALETGVGTHPDKLKQQNDLFTKVAMQLQQVQDVLDSTPWIADTDQLQVQVQSLTQKMDNLINARGQSSLSAAQRSQALSPSPTLGTTRDAWLAKQPQNYYTIQVASFNTNIEAEKFIELKKLKDDSRIIAQVRQGETKFNVFFGIYPNRSEMNTDYQYLKTQYKIQGWGRKIADIQAAEP